MSMDIGQEPTGEQTTEEVVTQEPEGNSQEEQQPQADQNPFWGEVQRKLAPSVYQTIKPDLDKADAEARRRIEELNTQYSPWKSLAEQGYTPEHATSAFGVVNQLNDPQYQVQLYESLGNFLRENGRLPNEAELQQQVAEDEGEADPRDQQIQTLQQQQDAILNFFQQQAAQEQQQAAAQEADSWLGGEMDRIQKANPRLGPDDLNEVVRIAAFNEQRTGKIDMDLAVQQFNGLVQRIRTAPRAADGAPRIPSGPGGGTPSGDTPVEQMTSQQRRDLVVQRLTANRQQQ